MSMMSTRNSNLATGAVNVLDPFFVSPVSVQLFRHEAFDFHRAY